MGTKGRKRIKPKNIGMPGSNPANIPEIIPRPMVKNNSII
jgi:hypothetical protein